MTTIFDDLLAAAKRQEQAEAFHLSCAECEGNEIPELCEACFPLYDDARVMRRAAVCRAEEAQSRPPFECFRSNSPEQKALQREAARRAHAAGWKAVGSTYVHESGTTYLMSDMDGWLDLCTLECIELEPTAPKDADTIAREILATPLVNDGGLPLTSILDQEQQNNVAHLIRQAIVAVTSTMRESS